MKELKQVNSRIRQFEERLQQEILNPGTNRFVVQQFKESLEFLHQRRRELKDGKAVKKRFINPRRMGE